MSNLSRVLREYRWASKMSVRELAKRIGFSAATLCRIENGEEMDGQSLRKILLWLMK